VITKLINARRPGVITVGIFKELAKIPSIRVNLTRFHSVFSPNSKLLRDVVPQKPVEEQENLKPKAYSMTWAQRLKRVFAIEVEKFEKCGGPVRIIQRIALRR
jgi:hypothetical protein